MLEAHFLAGGSIMNVVRALIAAEKANIEISFQQAAAIDLAGRNIVDAVQTSVNPKVIDCPDPNKTAGGMLDAVAKDGIRLLVKARVTVRTNLDRLVGGATEDTIVARVGQGIVSAIGSMASPTAAAAQPSAIDGNRVSDDGKLLVEPTEGECYKAAWASPPRWGGGEDVGRACAPSNLSLIHI